ncbi:MAG TPA: hypothetical protein VE913_06020 [Longimicrobium sp.]|nr:hypothetical protein [Longimicrobium sp.]
MQGRKGVQLRAGRRWLEICSLAIAACIATPVSAQLSYQPGQAIQVNYGGEWVDGEFVELTPSGTQAIVRVKNAYSSGGFHVQAANFDGIRPRPVRPAQQPATRPAAPRPAVAAAAPVQPRPAAGQAQGPPRSGDYSILSYNGTSNPLRLGRINLSGTTYRFYNFGGELLGQGQYSFSGGTVTWRTGILKDYGWGGAFKTERGGRDHSIRLNYTTYAVNSR